MTEQLRRAYAGEYLGSAIASKGVLSLAAGVDGHRAVAAVQAYAKDHGRRRSQLESLVVLLSAIDEPATVQYLLSVSRRFKQASIQERARVLVEELAERKGWSPDQLADRTIPTAGFDDTGVLVLDYGPRAFTARMTPTFTLELSGPDGAVVKGLPARTGRRRRGAGHRRQGAADRGPVGPQAGGDPADPAALRGDVRGPDVAGRRVDRVPARSPGGVPPRRHAGLGGEPGPGRPAVPPDARRRAGGRRGRRRGARPGRGRRPGARRHDERGPGRRLARPPRGLRGGPPVRPARRRACRRSPRGPPRSTTGAAG